jgi:acyl-CoA thioesterase
VAEDCKGEEQQRAEGVSRYIESADRAAQALGIRLREARPGYALMELTVRPDMANAAGTCQGGVIFTLADTAFACACNSHNELTVAAGCSIEFLLPGRVGDVLRAEAAERILVKRAGICDVTIRRQDDTVIALFRGKSHRIGGPVVKLP